MNEQTFQKGMIQNFLSTRFTTESLCSQLEKEDYVVQAIPEVSPTKWHLAHTSWFFERFILKEFARNYTALHPSYNYLFNSYYESIGPFFERTKRGTLSRPTVQEIYQYRSRVNESVCELLKNATQPEIFKRLELGIHHEQQHQELLLTDIKYNLWVNPSRPSLFPHPPRAQKIQSFVPIQWIPFQECITQIGPRETQFFFDNEAPPHRYFLNPFQISSRLITNAEYEEFIFAGGYQRPDLWLSEGWRISQERGWKAPLYWERTGDHWQLMTLFGMQPIDPHQPVCHLSYYEADAFARWRGKRLPLEQEWEHVTQLLNAIQGNFLESKNYQPLPVQPSNDHTSSISQLYGDVWEWTQSAYTPYPGFKPLEGSLGEYNGKFMCNQMVLRGGSFATSITHIRPSYRNFFPPDSRWQFTGIRLAAA